MALIVSARDKVFTPLSCTFFLVINLLIGSELVPISLISKMAHDLNRTVGEVGYTITAVGIASFLTALLLKPCFPKLDRRYIILSVGIILTISNILVARATSYEVMLLGRAMLGLCVGAFWSLSNSILQREIDSKVLPKAMSFVFSGVSISSVISLPLCSYLSDFISWRTIFEVIAALSLIATIALFVTLPSIKAHQTLSIKSLTPETKRRFYSMLMATLVCFGGYYVVFSYIQLFMEDASESLNHIAASFSASSPLMAEGLSLFSKSLLTIFALFNVAGTVLAGVVYSKSFHKTFITVPLIYCLLLAFLALSSFYAPSLLVFPLFLMGLCFGLIPISFSLWAMRHTPEHTEAVGCINVALIQLTIGSSSMIGGVIVDNTQSAIGLVSLSLISFIAYALAYLACKGASPRHIEERIDAKLVNAA